MKKKKDAELGRATELRNVSMSLKLSSSASLESSFYWEPKVRQITDMLGAILLPKLRKTNRACLQALKKGICLLCLELSEYDLKAINFLKMDGMPYKLV